MSRPADEQHPADDPLARHREELKRRFPLPAPVKKSRKPPSLLGWLIGAMALGLVWLDPSYRSAFTWPMNCVPRRAVTTTRN